MENEESDFEALEKQLANDALEKAPKDFHREITKEIEHNKKDFSAEIRNILTSFKENLEKNIAEEIDEKISELESVQLTVSTVKH